MKIRIKKEKRKSIALSLSPEEITIILPDLPKSDVNVIKLLDNLQAKDIQLHESITQEEFRELIDKWTNRLQVKPGRIQVRNMKNKWASCSPKKNIVFNSLLESMPREFVEYVICHELLHLKVPRHNKLFRNLLSIYMPNWKEIIANTIRFTLKKERRFVPTILDNMFKGGA